jgi:uncharacterized protein
MVTRDTPWPAGTPCWVDVSVDDVAQAIDFYRGLFGWDIEVGGAEAGGYSIARKDGRMVAGLGPKMGSPDQPSAWMTYLATGSADQTADTIKAAGGQLLAGPIDVTEQGRMAVAADPAGGVFGLWQGGLTTGVGLANEPGSLCWSEQLSSDFEGSKAFYQAVFGYGYQNIGEFPYSMLMIGEHEVGGIGQQAGQAGWFTYFAVSDADESLALAQHLGGSVIRPAWDSDYGRMAALADDQGAAFSVIAPLP